MQVKLLKMEASCNFCSSIYTLAPSCLSLRFRQKRSNLSSFIAKNRTFLDSISIRATASSSSSSSGGTKAVTTRRRNPKNGGTNGGSGKNAKVSEIPAVSTKGSSGKVVDKVQVKRKKQQEECFQDDGPVNVRALHQNGDPLGRKDLGKCVVRWLSQGMRAMALDFVTAEMQGEFAELKQRMEPGLTFVIQAQPYINAVPMPLGLEAICLKACTHYPTLFDNFQRELREVLQDLQSKSSVQDWRETESWKLLKDLASSAQHKAIARKESQPKSVPGVMGMDLEKAKAIQSRIDDFANRMSDLLHIERDAELEFTQEELNAVPAPDVTSEAQKPLEFLVSHAQPEQELCDTICNLTAVSTSIGLGGMHLVLFKLEGNHRLPPTNLSPGDMVCVRICDSRGAGATSCMQGFVHNLGEDERSISLALESLQGDTTFSKLLNSVPIPKLTNQNSIREGRKMASSMLTKQFLGAPFSSFGSGQQPSKLCSSNLRFPTHRSQHKRLEIQAAGNTFGNYFRVTTFGESHGGGVGCIIDGCPPRLPLSESDMQVELDRRRPGQSRITTPRKETDTCKISSGTADGLTTGSPIKVEVPNTDQRGNDYSEMSLAYRPSHADATYDFKYGVRSVQGGGRSSARETIGRVAAGAVAKKILKLYSGTEILAYVSQVHNVVLPEDLVDNQTVTLEQIESNIVRCPNPEYAEKMIGAIDYVRVRGDSVGGVVTCIVRNVPRGLGTPVFDKLEAELAKACMSLPATKGFEFGSGFAGTFMTGSEHNDEFFMDEHDQIRTKTNRSGGIQGGISNGEIINMRVAFKPTSTIARKQHTVSRDKHETELIARGRHDPCVVPRAVPMVEAMVALVLVDQLMTQYAQCMLFPVNPTLQEPLQPSTTKSA